MNVMNPMENPGQSSNTEQTSWQANIRRELKLAHDAVLVKEIEPGISLDPTLTVNEIPDELVILWPEQPWQVGQKLNVEDLDGAHFQLRNAVRHGAQSLWLVLQRNMEMPDFQHLFAGIQLDLITLFIEPADATYALNTWRELDQYLCLQDTTPSTGGYFFPEEVEKHRLDWPDLSQRYPGWYWNKITTPELPFFVDRLQFVLDAATRICQSFSEFFPGNIDRCLTHTLVIWPGDNRLVAHLAATRALHLLWQQLYLGDEAKPLTILGTIGGNAFVQDIHQNMIRAASMATTMATTGVHSIFIDPSGNGLEHQERYNRLALNVQHLLQLESHLQPMTDVLSGSYQLDDLTRQFAETAWSQWQSHS